MESFKQKQLKGGWRTQVYVRCWGQEAESSAHAHPGEFSPLTDSILANDF